MKTQVHQNKNATSTHFGSFILFSKMVNISSSLNQLWIENLGQCGRQNMLWLYLKIWEWEWIFGRAVKAISSPGVRSPWHQGWQKMRYYPLKSNLEVWCPKLICLRTINILSWHFVNSFAPYLIHRITLTKTIAAILWLPAHMFS